MTNFYLVILDDAPAQVSTDFEALRSLNPKTSIYKSTLSEKVTDLLDDATPYDGLFFYPYGSYDAETNTYMSPEDVDDIYASKVYSIGEEAAIEWLESLYDAYTEAEYIRGNKVSNALVHEC